MSGSVLLSDIHVSCLLWKIEGTTTNTEVIGYVDDLRLTTPSPHMSTNIIATLKKFETDFALNINALKTCLWGNDLPFLRWVAEAHGFVVSFQVHCSGG